jgi:phage terminase large subunit-like protein
MQERVRKDKVRYDIWVQQGYIMATPGNVVDYRFILNQITKDAELYDLREMAIDRWGATKIIQDLQDMGFEDEKDEHAPRHLIRFGQGFASMSRPTKELRKLIQGGEINHGNNPVLNWMSGNMVVKTDAAGNLKPDKEKSTEKIDGLVAMVMALDRALINPQVASVYEEKDVLLI